MLSVAIAGMVALTGCSSQESHSVEDAPIPNTAEASAEQLSELANLKTSIQDDQISEDNYSSIVGLGESFVNLYTGAVAEQVPVSFRNYIANENLLQFADTMLKIEQQQELNGGNGVIFGRDNEFAKAEIKKVDHNLYYLNLPFSNEGSGMSCKLLIQSVNNSLVIADLYFGNKDGADTFATGHPAVRKVDNPELWNDREWVADVMQKLETYETG
ncbi:hypothetical protein C2I18_00645 [Paenibacillus sp. PK3_47]|nr:hypothetical protein C2I18_00645 [Paenibacillus sp. PK3_47]